jgi:hypothetical protein
MITLILIVIFIISDKINYKLEGKDENFWKNHKKLYHLFRFNQDFKFFLAMTLSVMLTIEILCFIFSI